MNFLKTGIYTVVFLILLYFSFKMGYNYRSDNSVSLLKEVDTVFIKDTFKYVIYDKVPEYILIRDSVKYRDEVWADSVIRVNKVDTLELLRKYYAVHYYIRSWTDSLISIIRHDAISENDFIDSKIEYEFLQPRSIVRNIQYSYNQYLYGGITIPFGNFNYTGLQISYAGSRFATGLIYQPGIKTLSLSLGGVIKSF